ncbi:hypothetical protein [Paenarthrobacter nicotinovorans]|uniref:hypothetical protein n=1 Tax=Paenarthrobacter nicotinovorans TaxID=29320 RepID=UPI0007E6D129|nr:hypothetical protein [Paenarthrobacter nicotinovorans]
MENDTRFGSASIAQVAELLGKTEEEVAAEATKLVGAEAAHRGWLVPLAVSKLVDGVPSPRTPSEVEPLILRAFQQAQESSKNEWTSMAVPVLKNRLLGLSSRKFREADYGSPNIWHLVTKLPHLLATEGTSPLERVRILEPGRVQADDRETPSALDPAGAGRIRQDLWQAMFDYATQKTYVWDEVTGRARVLMERDNADIPVMPTLSAEDMNDLRQEFVQVQETFSNHDKERLDEWVQKSGPTVALPRVYRGLWNAHLKSHAANKLRAFFLAANLDVPKDLLLQAAAPSDSEHNVERERRLAHRYIDAMTADELRRLSIEMAVVLRVPMHSER